MLLDAAERKRRAVGVLRGVRAALAARLAEATSSVGGGAQAGAGLALVPAAAASGDHAARWEVCRPKVVDEGAQLVPRLSPREPGSSSGDGTALELHPPRAQPPPSQPQPLLGALTRGSARLLSSVCVAADPSLAAVGADDAFRQATGYADALDADGRPLGAVGSAGIGPVGGTLGSAAAPLAELQRATAQVVSLAAAHVKARTEVEKATETEELRARLLEEVGRRRALEERVRGLEAGVPAVHGRAGAGVAGTPGIAASADPAVHPSVMMTDNPSYELRKWKSLDDRAAAAAVAHLDYVARTDTESGVNESGAGDGGESGEGPQRTPAPSAATATPGLVLTAAQRREAQQLREAAAAKAAARMPQATQQAIGPATDLPSPPPLLGVPQRREEAPTPSPAKADLPPPPPLLGVPGGHAASPVETPPPFAAPASTQRVLSPGSSTPGGARMPRIPAALQALLKKPAVPSPQVAAPAPQVAAPAPPSPQLAALAEVPPPESASASADDGTVSFEDLPKGGKYKIDAEGASWYVHKQLGAYKQAVDGRFAREGDYGAPGTPLIVR